MTGPRAIARRSSPRRRPAFRGLAPDSNFPSSSVRPIGPRLPAAFLAASRLDARRLSRSEDCYRRRLLGWVADLGAPLIARFPARLPRRQPRAVRARPRPVPRASAGTMPTRNPCGCSAALARSPASSPKPTRSIASRCPSPTRCAHRIVLHALPRHTDAVCWRDARAIWPLRADRLPFDALTPALQRGSGPRRISCSATVLALLRRGLDPAGRERSRRLV